MVLCVVYFFFFKQKTAYGMRISDWSSDVCSSDLINCLIPRDDMLLFDQESRGMYVYDGRSAFRMDSPLSELLSDIGPCEMTFNSRYLAVASVGNNLHRSVYYFRLAALSAPPRSEEHTSELQSLMRISYAVFCLKKKNKQINKSNN